MLLIRKPIVLLFAITIIVTWAVVIPGILKKEEEKINLSTWVVDWDWEEGLNELSNSIDGYSSIQTFAAYYNHHDQPFYTEEQRLVLNTIFQQRNIKNKPIYLTFVNDYFHEDLTVSNKDSQLLGRIFENEQSMKLHINQMLELVNEYSFSGIVLDFENINEHHLPEYSHFLYMLSDELSERDLSLRVVLEAKMDFQKINLPSDASYIVMAYNLYGTHSGPGPKASFEFIDQVITKIGTLPGNPTICFSTGGYDWTKSGIEDLSEKEAITLQNSLNVKAIRDPASGSIIFSYYDTEGNRHTVWYGDAKTYAGWTKYTMEKGIRNFSIWRTGGLSDETIQWLSSFKEE